ncbi:hypothetical protein VNO77_38983 [Canavalia gladiata]|uniref:UME domain-containing protein n=1 Tax=Canavalia gladiata TaxID=3824 RepID=A0AAN9KA87_CANGL
MFIFGNELYDYLFERLASCLVLVREFAEVVFEVETKRSILPKLVVSQQHNSQAIDILYELAKSLSIDMVPLIAKWLLKFLAFTLHQTDNEQLISTMQFYHSQTSSNKQEIFAAALPALLDELRQALNRIEMLIRMMGSHLNTYVPKLIVLFMHTIDKEQLQKDAMHSTRIGKWNGFLIQCTVAGEDGSSCAWFWKCYLTRVERADNWLTNEMLRASHDPSVLVVLESIFSFNFSLLLNYALEEAKEKVLIIKGIKEPSFDSTSKVALLKEHCDGVMVKKLDVGHCPHNEVPK